MYVTVWTSSGAIKVPLPASATIEDLKAVLVDNLNYNPSQLEISYGGRYVRDEVPVARFPAETLVAEGPRYTPSQVNALRQQWQRQQAALQRQRQQRDQQEHEEQLLAERKRRQQQGLLNKQQQQQQQRRQQQYADPSDLLSRLFGNQNGPSQPRRKPPTPPAATSASPATYASDTDDEEIEEHNNNDADIDFNDLFGFGSPLTAFGAPRPRSRATHDQLQGAHHRQQLQRRQLETAMAHKAKQQQLAKQREETVAKMEAAREKLRQQQAAIRQEEEAIAAAERELVRRTEAEARKLKRREAEAAAAKAAAAKAAADAAKAEALQKRKEWERAARRERAEVERQRVAAEEAARASEEAKLLAAERLREAENDSAEEEDEEEPDEILDDAANEMFKTSDTAHSLGSRRETTTESFAPSALSREHSVIVTPHLQRVGLDETLHRPRYEQPSPSSSTASTPRSYQQEQHGPKANLSRTKNSRPTDNAHNNSDTDNAATANNTNSPSPSDATPASVIRITATFPELDDKVVPLNISYHAPVAELIRQLSEAEPEATKNGLRVMFCEKYVRALAHDTVRGIPLHDGSSIDVCTGRYLSENEMTLYLAERRLRGVTAEVASHQSKDGAGSVTRVQQAHWNEQLMKALTLLDSLQEVPEDIRMRRKASVKAVMAEQDRLTELNVV